MKQGQVLGNLHDRLHDAQDGTHVFMQAAVRLWGCHAKGQPACLEQPVPIVKFVQVIVEHGFAVSIVCCCSSFNENHCNI